MELINKSRCDQIICLGDIVGCNPSSHPYYSLRNANRCIDLIRNNCSITVAGNHDLYAVRKTPVHQTDFQLPQKWYSFSLDKRKKLAKGRYWLYEDHDLPLDLSPENIKFLESLPEFKTLSKHHPGIFFSHYIYPDLSGSTTTFIESKEQLTEHYKFMGLNKCLIAFSGHRHVDGFLFGNSTKLKYHSYKKVSLHIENCWIDAPSICRNSKSNGFLIFDTSSFELQRISLSSS